MDIYDLFLLFVAQRNKKTKFFKSKRRESTTLLLELSFFEEKLRVKKRRYYKLSCDEQEYLCKVKWESVPAGGTKEEVKGYPETVSLSTVPAPLILNLNSWQCIK